MSHTRNIAPVALAALALAVPGVAGAGTDSGSPNVAKIDLRTPDARDGITRPEPKGIDLRTPDARDGITKPEPKGIDLRTPDTQVGVRDVTRRVAPVLSARVVAVPQTGFAWGDAAIGAGAILALVLAGGGLALTVRQRRTTAIGH